MRCTGWTRWEVWPTAYSQWDNCCSRSWRHLERRELGTISLNRPACSLSLVLRVSLLWRRLVSPCRHENSGATSFLLLGMHFRGFCLFYTGTNLTNNNSVCRCGWMAKGRCLSKSGFDPRCRRAQYTLPIWSEKWVPAYQTEVEYKERRWIHFGISRRWQSIGTQTNICNLNFYVIFGARCVILVIYRCM